MEKINWTDQVRNEEVLQRTRGQEYFACRKNKDRRLSGLVTSRVGTVS
jgi:hypothetical protein